MAFWGCQVKSGKESAFVPRPESSEKLHLSQACLAPEGSSKSKRATLLVRVSEGAPLAVCALREGACESSSLDLVLDEYTEFSVVGNADIHLTGYFMPEYELDRDEDDDDDDDMAMGMEGAILGYDDFGIPVLADEYDSEEDSDYESEDEFDSAEEDLIMGEESDARRRSGNVIIEDITESLAGGVEKGNTKTHPQRNGKNDVEFEDDDVSGSDEEEDEEEEDEDEEDDDDDDVRAGVNEEEEEEKVKTLSAPEPEEALLGSKKRKAAEAAAAAPAAKKAAKVQKSEKGKKQKQSSDASPAADLVASSKKNVRRFANGFEIADIVKGPAEGKLAKAGKRVVVRYVGKLKNGSVFDQTQGKKTFAFRLGVGEVIKGGDRGVEGMRVGDKRKLTVPPQMGYGSSRVGSIPSNSTLYFDVELVDVK